MHVINALLIQFYDGARRALHALATDPAFSSTKVAYASRCGVSDDVIDRHMRGQDGRARVGAPVHGADGRLRSGHD